MKLLQTASLAAAAVSTASAIPWVVTSSNTIFKWGAHGDWQHVEGGLIDIGCSPDGSCWGASSLQQAWYGQNLAVMPSMAGWVYSDYGKQTAFTAISAGQYDGSGWAVDGSYNIYRTVRPTTPGFGSWDKVEGQLVDVAALDYQRAWGVNHNDDIFYHSNGSWQHVAGKLVRIAVCENGDVWGVNRAQDIFQRAGLNGEWRKLPGYATDVACKDNNAYVIGGAESIWHSNADQTDWVLMPGKAVVVG